MKKEIKYVGDCAVDSGTIMLIDPCYIIDKFDEDKYFEVTSFEGRAGVIENDLGIIAAPGLGDGSYPVYIETIDMGPWGKRVNRIIIECGLDEDEL
jgi:hypothetical protein